MRQNNYWIMGTIFISLSGLFFTAERIAERLAVGITDAGFASYSGSSVGNQYYPGFFDNFFVWFFFLIGLLLLVFGFLKGNK
ncbi:hypothetical protein [Neobacillus mesonae]|uniref:hypothetical protein n=1 Tax=Neobacillus mesonae TaxID=1193713 RepID=UPI00082E42C3|nr:hypothetical protein [Neobacillus mesonae]